MKLTTLSNAAVKYTRTPPQHLYGAMLNTRTALHFLQDRLFSRNYAVVLFTERPHLDVNNSVLYISVRACISVAIAIFLLVAVFVSTLPPGYLKRDVR